MFNILLGLIGISLIIFIHELGHFLAARACGVVVEDFSIGIGKKLYSFRHRNTEYCLRLFPIGGYCKMQGIEQFAHAAKKKEKNFETIKGDFFSCASFQTHFHLNCRSSF